MTESEKLLRIASQKTKEYMIAHQKWLEAATTNKPIDEVLRLAAERDRKALEANEASRQADEAYRKENNL